MASTLKTMHFLPSSGRLLLLLVFTQFVIPKCYPQDTIWFNGEFRVVNSISIVHTYPGKQLQTPPNNALKSQKDRVEWSHKMATCQILQLNQALRSIWDMDDRKKTVEAWDKDAFLVERFGIAVNYWHINKVRRTAGRHEKWLVNGSVEYLHQHKNRHYNHNRKLTAASGPGPPIQVKLYLPFFAPDLDSIFLGGTIHHELIHERRIGGHPSRKYRNSSSLNSWENAALELARKKPKKAKKSPQAWGYACRALDVSLYSFSE